MKAEDVRIGNLVYYHIVDKLNEPEEWDAENIIDCFDIAQMVENPESNEYKPIPLTEEWLLKFGFKKQKGYVNELSYSDFGVFRIYWPTEAYLVSLHFKPNETEWYPFLREGIKYVHQLQNIIYALTGKELTL